MVYPYGNISLWENRRRVRVLYCFREQVTKYLSNVQSTYSDTLVNARSESSAADEARTRINFMAGRAKSYVLDAKVGTSVARTSPPAAGSRTFCFDLFDELFNDLESYGIPYRIVIDMLEKAIGVYETDRSRAVRRTINPFWWVKRLFEEGRRMRFRLSSALGFNAEQTESNVLGKLARGILPWIAAVASLLVIANLLGFLDEIKDVLGL